MALLDIKERQQLVIDAIELAKDMLQKGMAERAPNILDLAIRNATKVRDDLSELS